MANQKTRRMTRGALTDDRIATVEDYAEIDFEPAAGIGAALTDEHIIALRIGCKMAALFMGKTEWELVAQVDKLVKEPGGADLFFDLLNEFATTKAWLAHCSRVLEGAEIRLLSAAAIVGGVRPNIAA
jgi:hypothetical protein